MPTQDTFEQYAAIGYHGQLNTNFNWNAASPLAEASDIPFGVAVVYGTADDQATLPGAAAEAADIVGITLRTQSVENTVDDTSVYREGRAMSVLVDGRMFIAAPDGSTAGAPVYVVPVTGVITSDAATGANVELPNARFVRTAAAGGITEIQLR